MGYNLEPILFVLKDNEYTCQRFNEESDGKYLCYYYKDIPDNVLKILAKYLEHIKFMDRPRKYFFNSITYEIRALKKEISFIKLVMNHPNLKVNATPYYKDIIMLRDILIQINYFIWKVKD